MLSKAKHLYANERDPHRTGSLSLRVTRLEYP